MKVVFEKLMGRPDEGFAVKRLRGAACNCSWHCHAETELILVQESQGYRIVGDNVASLHPGDLVLLGPNLPHMYQHADRFADTARPARCLLLQFEERIFSHLFALPAMAPVRRLLRRAENGLQFSGHSRQQVAKLLMEMLSCRGVRRITIFLRVLDFLAQSRSSKTISSSGFVSASTTHQQQRISRVCRFIDENYHRPIRLVEAAKLVHMSDGAFSRFFHAHLGKTFPSFVNDLRVGRACRLLAESDLNVTQVALACGYRNLSNFNRHFLRLKKLAPTEYRRLMHASLAVRPDRE